MNCPVCNNPMVEVPHGLLLSGWDLKKYRCEPCKITARVETTYSSDESAHTSTASQEKP